MLELFAFGAIVLLVYNLYKYWTVEKYIEKIEGPSRIPIFGNAIQLGWSPRDYLQSILNLTQQHNWRVFRLWLGPQPYVVVTDPDDVETILSSTTLLQKTDVYSFLGPWLREGLLTSYGSKWHKRRKMITPAFHFKILIDFLEVMNDCSTKFIGILQNKAKTGEIFDFQNAVQYCTMDVICETAMGIKINAMDNPDADIPIAFHDMCVTVQNRIFSAFKRSEFLFKFTQDYRKQQKALNILNSFTWEVIGKRFEKVKAEMEKKEEIAEENEINLGRKKQAFLDTLMTSTIDGSHLTTPEIAEEVSTFIFEGHDTTTSGISFATYVLSRLPKIQQKVFDEQKVIFGNDKDRYPTYQEIQDMKYLELVIKETERLFPSVPLIGRITENEIKIAGKVVPPNTGVVVNILGMGYNEKYFPDAHIVDPERFDKDNREGAHPYDYVPFSAGPRNCIGQKFAMLEMKSVLSKIVRNFEILPPVEGLSCNGCYMDLLKKNPYYPAYSAALTLKSDNGIQIRLRARNSKSGH